MSLKILTSPNSGRKLIEELKEKLKELKIDANNILLFTTNSTKRDAKSVMKVLKERYPEAEIAGCNVEGYMTKDCAWSRGIALMLIDCDKMSIAHSSGKSAKEAFSSLNRKLREKKKVVLFPMVSIPSEINVLKLLFYDKMYYYKYKRANDLEEKRRILSEYSKILESKMIFPPNSGLREMSGEVAGLCLIPLSAGYRTPILYTKGKECHRCCVGVGLSKVKMHFYDVFPERGKSFEETFEILKNYFGKVDRAKCFFSGIAIGEVNGLTATEFLKKVIGAKEIKEESLKEEKLKKGNLPLVSPYGFAIISKETFGSCMLGLQSYPINIYPSTFELDKFYSECIFSGEMYKGGITDFYGMLDKVESDTFKFFSIDYDVIPMFSKSVHKLRREIASRFEGNFLGIFAQAAFKSQKLDKRYMSEIEKGICFNGTGTATIVEVDLQ